jgi:hypothetical protein
MWARAAATALGCCVVAGTAFGVELVEPVVFPIGGCLIRICPGI